MCFYIFSTRFECSLPFFALVSSVVLHLLHSFRVWFYIFSTRFDCGFHIFSTRFECSFHIFSTRFECKNSATFAWLIRSWLMWLPKDLNWSWKCSILTDRVKAIFSTRFECGLWSSPLVSSVVYYLLHSFRVRFMIFSTRSECGLWSSPLFSSAVYDLLHSFRVWFMIFSTRFECGL